MKTSKLNFIVILLAVIICFMTLSITISLDSSNISADYTASALTADVETNYDAYTDSDILLGGNKTIREYPDSLHHSTASIDAVQKLSVNADDPIVQIIPRELFEKKGEYLYIGREYGFFVKTTANIFKGSYGQIEDPFNNSINVLVFDIITETDLDKTIDQVIVKVEPIFQYKYAYIDYRSTVFYSETTVNTFKFTYSIPENTNYIVAMPTSYYPANYNQSWDFFLKDISFSSTLYNEQHLNPINNDYVAQNDDGSFITQFDYKYDGFKNKEGGKDFGLSTASIVCSALGVIPPPVGTFFSGLGLVFGAIEYGKELDSITERNTHSNVMGTDYSNGAITAVNQYSTKDEQLAHYVDSNGLPRLTKNATCAIHGDDATGNIWFEQYDHATGYFKISNSSNGTQPWHTRLQREIGMTVVDEDGTEYCKNTVSQYKYMINEPAYEKIDLDSDEDLIFLPDGDNYFEYTPKYTSKYFFAFGQESNAEVFVKTENDNEFTKAFGTTKHYYPMEAGTKYLIKIHNELGEIFSLTMSPATSVKNAAANSEFLIKYKPTATDAYILSLSNSNFYITAIYKKTAELTYTSVYGIDNDKLSAAFQELDIVAKANDIYYLLLKNNSTETASCKLQKNICNTSMSVGSNAARHFIGGNNYKYYKFTLSGSNADVNFSFSGANINTNVSFCVFNEQGEVINITQAYFDGHMRLANLSAGTYYIGVRTEIDADLSVNVSKGEVVAVWKQLIDGKWTPINTDQEITLERNNIYYFSYWRENTIINDYKLINSSLDDTVVLEPNFGLNIGKLAYEYVCTSLFAVKRTNDEENSTLFMEELKIKVVYNKNEIQPLNVEYKNQIALSMTKPDHFVSMTYSISYVSATNPGVTEPLIGNLTITTRLNENILKRLYQVKAIKATFILNKCTIKSGIGNESSREISDFDIKHTINCFGNDDNNSIGGKITNALHLYNIRFDQSYDRFLGYVIDLSTLGEQWTPIPELNCDISGFFHVIMNLKITVPSTDGGFFGLCALNNAEILGITLLDFDIRSQAGSTGQTWTYTGAFAGINRGKITSCIAMGTLVVYKDFGTLGGIAGQNDSSGTINSCMFQGNSSKYSVIEGAGDIGGITGQNYGKIYSTSVSYTNLNHYLYNSGRSIGGLVGYDNGGTISDCSIDAISVKNINDGKKKLYPKMGLIVGDLTNATCTYKSYSVSSQQASCGSFASLSKYKKYCFQGADKAYGVLNNGQISKVS